MNPVSSLDAIAELIRRKVTLDATAQKNHSKFTVSAQKTAQIEGRLQPGQLKEKIRSATNAIEVDDPKRKQKVVQIFVQSVLVWQFGESLVNDPEFVALVEDVAGALSAHQDLILQAMELE